MGRELFDLGIERHGIMRSTRVFYFITVYLVLLSLSGCAGLYSYARSTDQARLSISQGRFPDALAAFPDHAASGKDEVLIRLERATLLQAMGKYEDSAREFESAAARIRQYEDRAVVSASKTMTEVGSLFWNEQVLPYEGEDFEKILLHTLDAVNYLMTGDLEGARVEIRNAYQRQNELYEKHAGELEKAQKESSGIGWEESFQKADRNRYDALRQKAEGVMSVYQNAFAYYVSALVYELSGRDDEAYIDLKKGIQAAPWSGYMQKDLIRLSRKMKIHEDSRSWEARFGDPGRDYGNGVDVFIMIQHGAAPVKEALTLPIPISHGGWTFASLPVYRYIPAGMSHAEIVCEGNSHESSPVSDIEATASRNLLDEYPILFAKQVARSYIKARITSRLHNEYGTFGVILGTLATLITEQADLRTWSTLPKAVHAARVFVPEETRRISIRTIPENHGAVIDIPHGTRHLIVLCRNTDAGLYLQTKAY